MEEDQDGVWVSSSSCACGSRPGAVLCCACSAVRALLHDLCCACSAVRVSSFTRSHATMRWRVKQRARARTCAKRACVHASCACLPSTVDKRLACILRVCTHIRTQVACAHIRGPVCPYLCVLFWCLPHTAPYVCTMCACVRACVRTPVRACVCMRACGEWVRACACGRYRGQTRHMNKHGPLAARAYPSSLKMIGSVPLHFSPTPYHPPPLPSHPPMYVRVCVCLCVCVCVCVPDTRTHATCVCVYVCMLSRG